MRGRCSVSTSSPPVKSWPGSESRMATWIGKARKRRWRRLPGVVTELQEILVLYWIALIQPHPSVPLVGNVRQERIERGAQAADHVRQRVFEVAILALSEAVPGHADVAAKMLL